MPADEAERWRVFLAIEVPDAVRAALTGPLDSLEPLREVARVDAVERIHLTLARVVRPPRAPERKLLRDWATRWGSRPFGEIPVDHVRLMRSQLGGGPARYTTLATFDLQ